MGLFSKPSDIAASRGSRGNGIVACCCATWAFIRRNARSIGEDGPPGAKGCFETSAGGTTVSTRRWGMGPLLGVVGVGTGVLAGP